MVKISSDIVNSLSSWTWLLLNSLLWFLIIKVYVFNLERSFITFILLIWLYGTDDVDLISEISSLKASELKSDDIF